MKKIAILFAALAALVSCNKENPVTPETPSQETYSVTLTAVAPTAGDDTKTTLVEGGKFVHWSKGDAIKVLFFAHCSESDIRKYEGYVSEGQVFTSYFDDETSKEARFRIENWGNSNLTKRPYWFKERGIAVYPASAYAKSEKINNWQYSAISSEVSFQLPSEQLAVKGNIEPNLNFSYAYIDRDSFINTLNGESETNLQFNNACALVKLTMPESFGDKNITSIAITSNTDKALTGKGSVDLKRTDYYSTANVIADPFHMSVSNGSGVTLKAEEGTYFEAGAEYYAVVWPGTHTGGLTITFTAEDGATATKVTKEVAFEASHVKPYKFGELTFGGGGAASGDKYPWDCAEGETYDYYYSDGTVGNNPKPVGKEVLGVVFSIGDPRVNDPRLPEDCKHGLAISLNEVRKTWHSESLPDGNYADEDLANPEVAWGYEVKLLWKELYPQIDLGIYDFSEDFADLSSTKTSGWYIPTAKEWIVIAKNEGTIEGKLNQCEGAVDFASNRYWLPTMRNTYKYNRASTISINNGDWSTNYGDFPAHYHNARPIFAF